MEAKRNNSKKRKAVLEAICSTTSHPSAENVYTVVKASIPEISLGTVYRNISVLEQDGAIITVGNVNGQARYDGRTDDHAHFICKSCGKVIDVEIDDNSPKLFDDVEAILGVRPESHNLSFTGVCPECKAN